MLARSPTAAARRQRRYAARQRAGVGVYEVEADAAVVGTLVDLGWLLEAESGDRRQVGAAIGAAPAAEEKWLPCPATTSPEWSKVGCWSTWPFELCKSPSTRTAARRVASSSFPGLPTSRRRNVRPIDEGVSTASRNISGCVTTPGGSFGWIIKDEHDHT
jgi:hypothetical protein